ncbi:hypothetical protein ACFL53_03150 [Pseudomonadota bacterium]
MAVQEDRLPIRNKLDANKTHKLFVEDLLLLTTATYNPATGKMGTGLVDGLLLDAAQMEMVRTLLADASSLAN